MDLELKKDTINLQDALVGIPTRGAKPFIGTKNKETTSPFNESSEADEVSVYTDLIKRILDRDYGKEVVFYNSGEWYSREHSRIISLQELLEFALRVTDKKEYYE